MCQPGIGRPCPRQIMACESFSAMQAAGNREDDAGHVQRDVQGDVQGDAGHTQRHDEAQHERQGLAHRRERWFARRNQFDVMMTPTMAS